MFEEARLLGPTERSIVVQTRKRTSLKNLVELEPGLRERRNYQLLMEKFGANWVPRKSPVGIYNCAGHVWAARRSSLLETDQWRLVLIEDEYRRLASEEQPWPGDLALYRDRANGDMLHVGEILELRPGLAPDSARIPWVLSKWNSTSGEVMHYVNDVPYPRQGIEVIIEYWTDRPARLEEGR